MAIPHFLGDQGYIVNLSHLWNERPSGVPIGISPCFLVGRVLLAWMMFRSLKVLKWLPLTS